MSKSYRKYPSITQEKPEKRFTNRRVRHQKISDVSFAYQNAEYRKLIHFASGCKYPWTWGEAKEQYYDTTAYWNKRIQEEYTLDEWYQHWKSCTIRK